MHLNPAENKNISPHGMNPHMVENVIPLEPALSPLAA